MSQCGVNICSVIGFSHRHISCTAHAVHTSPCQKVQIFFAASGAPWLFSKYFLFICKKSCTRLLYKTTRNGPISRVDTAWPKGSEQARAGCSHGGMESSPDALGGAARWSWGHSSGGEGSVPQDCEDKPSGCAVRKVSALCET